MPADDFEVMTQKEALGFKPGLRLNKPTMSIRCKWRRLAASAFPPLPRRPHPGPLALGRGAHSWRDQGAPAHSPRPGARRANDVRPFRAFLTDSGGRFFQRRGKGLEADRGH